MQCKNCEFENMPGVNACGRCGASLRLATAVIDVHPPRAGRWSKRIDRILPRGLPYRVRDAVNAMLFHSEVTAGALPEWSLLLRMVVVGWPPIYMGGQPAGR